MQRLVSGREPDIHQKWELRMFHSGGPLWEQPKGEEDKNRAAGV